LAASRNEAWESDDLGHGYFTQALLNAFQTRTADKSPRDGELQVTELMGFVKDEVTKLSRKPQEVVTYVEAGINIADWAIAKLPADIGNAQTEKDQLAQALKDWRTNNYIRAATSLICEEALNRWLEKLSEGSPPDARDVRIVEEIREHAKLMSQREFPPERIGRSLDTTIAGLPK
jgi:hypothetical protein